MNELYDKAIDAKTLYKTGRITRDEAKAIIQPYIDFFNNKARELSKKYNQKYKPFSFSAFIR